MTQGTRPLDSAPPSGPFVVGDGARGGTASEAALWLFGLTASTAVLSALLLLGILAQAASVGTWLFGFVSALALVTGVVGVAALAYVALAASRAGYLQLPAVLFAGRAEASQRSEPARAGVGVPVRAGDPPPPASGLRVVPALPADLAARRRRELQEQRLARASQARAIAAAEATQRRVQPVPRPPVAPARSVQVRRAAPRLRPTSGPAARRSTASIRAAQPVTRPASIPPALRLTMPAAHRQVRSAQLQVAVADIRSGRQVAGSLGPRMPDRVMPLPMPHPVPMPPRRMAPPMPPAPPTRPQAPVPARSR